MDIVQLVREAEQITRAAERCAAAYRRGYERGRDHNSEQYFDSAPLSGEWAGYSPIELLGDLFEQSEQDWLSARGLDSESSLFWSDIADMSEYRTEIENHYEQGYRAAFNDADIVLCAGCEELIHRERVDSSFTESESGEREYFCSDYCIK